LVGFDGVWGWGVGEQLFQLCFFWLKDMLMAIEYFMQRFQIGMQHITWQPHGSKVVYRPALNLLPENALAIVMNLKMGEGLKPLW
jgi:hypothetical protein